MRPQRNFFFFWAGWWLHCENIERWLTCQDVRSRGTVIGATMERYAILRKLGQGTYGSVYLCGKPTPTRTLESSAAGLAQPIHTQHRRGGDDTLVLSLSTGAKRKGQVGPV